MMLNGFFFAATHSDSIKDKFGNYLGYGKQNEFE